MNEPSDKGSGPDDSTDRDHEPALEQHSASDPDAPLTPAERRMEERIGRWLEKGRAREERARAAGLSPETARESWTWR